MRVTMVRPVVTLRLTLVRFKRLIPVDGSHEGDHGEDGGDPEADTGQMQEVKSF